MTPELPDEAQLLALGFSKPSEVGGGKQSHVMTVDSAAGPLAVKLSDAAYVDKRILQTRMSMVRDLARFDRSVVPPARIGEDLVHQVGKWIMTATPFISGMHPDPSRASDAYRMGEALAKLHESLSRFPKLNIPFIAALRAPKRRAAAESRSALQLLHGDFNNTNIVQVGHEILIFDFDDCGYGPVELDVAIALYVVLFDSMTGGVSAEVYDRFRTAFLDGYSDRSGRQIKDETIDYWIDVRVSALGHWLANPHEAPVGIRTSDQEWRGVLRRFVEGWARPDRAQSP